MYVHFIASAPANPTGNSLKYWGNSKPDLVIDQTVAGLAFMALNIYFLLSPATETQRCTMMSLPVCVCVHVFVFANYETYLKPHLCQFIYQEKILDFKVNLNQNVF